MLKYHEHKRSGTSDLSHQMILVHSYAKRGDIRDDGDALGFIQTLLRLRNLTLDEITQYVYHMFVSYNPRLLILIELRVFGSRHT
jgi:hypothetical protein